MGKIQVDHTGAGGGITLSSDGTDLLLDGTAIGGGGAALELYAENPSTPTTPVATGANAVAIGTNASATGVSATAIGENSIASGTRGTAIGGGIVTGSSTSIAIGSGALASRNVATAIGVNSTAAGAGSLALGYSAQAITGTYATAISRSYASGADSLAAAIANNTSTYGAQAQGAVAIGALAKATGSSSVALGYQSRATSSNAHASGKYSLASGAGSFAHGHIVSLASATASGTGAVAFGSGSFADKQGKYAFASDSYWSNNSSGTAQYGLMVLRRFTSDGTPGPLVSSSNNTASAINQIILPNNSAYAFSGTIVARQQASVGTACAAWKVEGLIRRESGAGTTVLVNSATTVLDNTPAWGMALTADTTYGGLKIEVTGAAATDIRWVATINTSEVTY